MSIYHIFLFYVNHIQNISSILYAKNDIIYLRKLRNRKAAK